MKVTFDPNIKLAGIGVVPWNRLGPERFFDNYTIASLYDWDAAASVQLPRLISLTERNGGKAPELSRINTASMLNNELFQDILSKDLKDYVLMTYRPVHVPPELNNRTFLMTDEKFTEAFENKANFRNLMSDRLKFPEYRIIDRAQLGYEQIAGQAVIIQDELLSGGKGSFIVKTEDDYNRAVRDLNNLSYSSRVVVSKLIPRVRERTIQVCITGHGVFVGPLQRQIVAHPLLANTNVPEGDKFCGVQILAEDQNTATHQQAIEYAQQIADEMSKQGYRGIFGVDFLLDEDNQLYVLEVNARITGATPLLTALYEDGAIPFYLLHILELGNYQYQITDSSHKFDQTGALLVMHALENHRVTIESTPKSGTYRVENDHLIPISSNIDIKNLNRGEFIIQDYMVAGMIIKPGGRLITLQFREQILDEKSDQLYNNTVEIISTVQKHIHLKEIS